jgi:hypothetical protein
MITIASIYFNDKLEEVTTLLFSIILNYTKIPEISPSITIYIIISFVWFRLLWQVLLTHSSYYEFEENRIVLHFGVINKSIDYIEYFRIKDYTVKRSLVARMAGLYSLSLVSTDRTHPYLYMSYLTNFKGRESELREFIARASSTGKGREIDVV